MHNVEHILEFSTIMSYSHIIRMIESVPHKHKLFHPCLSPNETIAFMSTTMSTIGLIFTLPMN